MEGNMDNTSVDSDYKGHQITNMDNLANKIKGSNLRTIFQTQQQIYYNKQLTDPSTNDNTSTNNDIEKIRNLREKLNRFGSLEPTELRNKGYDETQIEQINKLYKELNDELKRLSALNTLKMNEDLGKKLAYTNATGDVVAEGGKFTKPTKATKPTKPTITGKKEILGKQRCIYKKVGDRKEYVKYKGDLITVKDYKKIISVKK
jgi:hypothetical protein